IGKPQDIYANPRTSYVADFVGSANRFKVQTGIADGTHLTVSLGALLLKATDRRIDAAGNEAMLILRPEDLHLASEAQSGAQSIAARVRSRQYLGSKTSYRLELVDGQQLIAELHGEKHDAYLPGDQVSVGVNPDQ